MPELTIQQAYTLALQHHRAGRLRDAEALYRQILAADPNHGDALQMLGGVAFLAGHSQNAIELIRRAITVRPDAPDYHGNLAIVLASNGDAEAAIHEFRQAIVLRPDYAEAHYNLGKILAERGRTAEAIEAYQSAVSFSPLFPEALNNLGDLLRRTGQLDQAAKSLHDALAHRPDFAEALFNLALVLQDQDELEEARTILKRLLDIQPTHAEAHNELGNVFRELNQPREALAAYQKALALKPDFAEARWHAAMALLSLGEFDAGWEAYEARKHLPGVWREPDFTQPAWDGSPLEGRGILLWSEQGFGDTIQFVRCARSVAAMGGRVRLRCQAPLVRLMSGLVGIEQVIAEGDPLPAFDVQCPLMSLPRIFRTTLNSIPAPFSYLAADVALAAKWQARMFADSSFLKIGLTWATNLQPASARKRSIDPVALGQLGNITGATFFSLQKSPPGSGPIPPPPGLKIMDFTEDISDFADTAALISNLDLVITCDTAVAHLAGAMGRPTWIALPFASPWRWMHERRDSPWYPAVRLFRQPRPGDWLSTIAQIAAELATFPFDRRGIANNATD